MIRRLTLSAALVLATSLPLASQSRVAVLSEPGTPVVATEILLTVGPADEEDDQAGLAYLAARTVIAPIRAELDSLGAHLSINPQKDALSFSVVSAPDVWEEATEVLAAGLFRHPPDSVTMERERRTIVGELGGRSANPADAATREMDRAFFGADHPWGRPTVGTPQSVQRIRFSDVREFLRSNFTPARAIAAAVGPLNPAAGIAHLQPLLGSTDAAPVELVPFRPAEAPVRRDYNSITTWVTVSFRFPEAADEEAMRFIGHLAATDLSFSPLQRSVYNVESEVVTRVGGGEIRIQMVVPPEEADHWEERAAEVISRLTDSPMPPDVFASHLRRYTGERLMALSSPEDRAHAAARQLLLQGEVGSLAPAIDDLSVDRMREAAEALSAPTVILLGPMLDN